MARQTAAQRAASLANLKKARAALAGRRAKSSKSGGATAAAPSQHAHAHALTVKAAANPVAHRRNRLRRPRIRL